MTTVAVFGGGGFLGQRYDPLCGEPTAFIDPSANPKDRAHPPEVRGEPRVPGSVLAEGITLDRLGTRQTVGRRLQPGPAMPR